MPGGIDSSTVVNDRLEGGDSSIQIDRLSSEGSAQSLSPRLRRARAASAIDHKRNLQESGIPSDVLDALLPGDDIIELENPISLEGFCIVLASVCSILSLVGQPLSYFPL